MPYIPYTTKVLDAWFGRISDGLLTGVTKSANGIADPANNIGNYINANWVQQNGSIIVPADLLAVFNDPTTDGVGLQVAMRVEYYLGDPTQTTVEVLRFNQGTKVTWFPGDANNVFDGPLFYPNDFRISILDAAYEYHGSKKETALDGTPIDKYMTKYFTYLRAADNATCIQPPRVPNDHFGDPYYGFQKSLVFTYIMIDWAFEDRRRESVPEGDMNTILSRSVLVTDAWYGYDDAKTALRAGVTATGTNIAQYIDVSWPYLSDGYTIPANFGGNVFFDPAPNNKSKRLVMQVLDKISGNVFYLTFNASSSSQAWSVFGNRKSRGAAPEFAGPLVPSHDTRLTLSNGIYGAQGGSTTTALDRTPIADYVSKYCVFVNSSGQPVVMAPYSMNDHFGDPNKGKVKTLSFTAYDPMLDRTTSASFGENDGGKTWAFPSDLTINPDGSFPCAMVTDAWQARKETCDIALSQLLFGSYIRGITAANYSQTFFPSPMKSQPTIAVLVSGGGWRSLDSSAQFFDMLKTPDVNLMQYISLIYGVSGGSWATSLSLMTGQQDRFWRAPYTDSINDPNALPPGLVQMLSPENANNAYGSVTSGPSVRMAILHYIMSSVLTWFTYLLGPRPSATLAALWVSDYGGVRSFVSAAVWDGSRTMLGNYSTLLGRQFGLITPLTAEVGVGLWQQGAAPIGFTAAINQEFVRMGSDNWYAFDAVPLNGERDSNTALGGLTQVAEYVRTDLHGATVAAINRTFPLSDYPARILDAASTLGICGSAPAYISDVLKPIDGQGFVGTVKTSNKQSTPLWDAGCDINVPIPLACGYVASVGRPDICIVLDNSYEATYPEELEKAIMDGWYKPYNSSTHSWFDHYDMERGEVRVYFPATGSQLPVLIYGFGELKTSTIKMSRTQAELKETRAIVQLTAMNVKKAFDALQGLTTVPASGYLSFKSTAAVQDPAPRKQATPEDVYSLDLFGLLFADEIAVWWSNPTATLPLQRDVALEHLFRGPEAAEAMAVSGTGDTDVGKALSAFLAETGPLEIPLRLAHAWANDIGRRIDTGNPANDTALLEELLRRPLKDTAMPTAAAPEFRTAVLLLISLRCIQTRAIWHQDAPRADRVVQFLERMQQRGAPELRFSDASADPLQVLADMVTTGAPNNSAGRQ
jgi:hypothetical protein